MKFLFSFALISMLTPTALAQHYDVTDLGPITPVAINVWGQIAGNLNNHAVIWTKKGVRDLGVVPGGTFTMAGAINDLGVVAGTGDGPGVLYDSRFTGSCPNLVQPFVWSPRKGFTVPSSLPAAYDDIYSWCNQKTYSTGINIFSQVTATNRGIGSFIDPYLWDPVKGVSTVPMFWYQAAANGINDRGEIVGENGYFPHHTNAVVFYKGVASILPSLLIDDNCSGANSVNDFGAVVGWDVLRNGTPCPLDTSGSYAPIHAMLWQSSTAAPTDLGTLPGDLFSMAVKINLFGVVIGMSGNTVVGHPQCPILEVVGRPFIWDSVQGMRNLNDEIWSSSGWTLQSVSDINALGEIVGTGNVNGETHGFLLTPRFF